MPFTLAHPAAIVPLKRFLGKWGVLSALAIGSMTPDFSYFLPLGIGRYETHSFLALFWFCLPVGLGLFYVYHTLFSPVLLNISPKGFQQRLNPEIALGRLPKASIFTVVFSLLVGASTHIIWDLFTHPPHSLPAFLSTPMSIVLIQFDGYTFYVYRLLQHISTLVGLGFLIYWIWVWYKKTPATQQTLWKPSQKIIRVTRFPLIILPIVIGLLYGFQSVIYLSTATNVSNIVIVILAIRDFIIYGGRYLLLIWVLLGVAYYILRLYHLSIRKH